MPYSNYINKRINDSGYLAGCTTTAIAQIIAYHGYLKSTAPYKAPNFNNASFNNANIGVERNV
ncbi:MAG: C10 family peptidase [Treponema sp.]|nr:C10 family peptidase [Treponema sp.]